jgi:hypothetical protein
LPEANSARKVLEGIGESNTVVRWYWDHVYPLTPDSGPEGQIENLTGENAHASYKQYGMTIIQPVVSRVGATTIIDHSGTAESSMQERFQLPISP